MSGRTRNSPVKDQSSSPVRGSFRAAREDSTGRRTRSLPQQEHHGGTRGERGHHPDERTGAVKGTNCVNGGFALAKQAQRIKKPKGGKGISRSAKLNAPKKRGVASPGTQSRNLLPRPNGCVGRKKNTGVSHEDGGRLAKTRKRIFPRVRG